MAFKSLSGTTGYLSVGITLVRITANMVGQRIPSSDVTFAAGARLPAHTIFVQQYPTNTGYLYLCDRSTADRTTGVGVVAVLIPPVISGGVATSLDRISWAIPYAPGSSNASDYYLVSDQASQKAIVSIQA